MSSEKEVEILRKAIAAFHSEKPHSKIRRDILSNTVVELQNATSESADYWTQKRVRTWFWNHRAEVPQAHAKRKNLELAEKEDGSPPKKVKKTVTRKHVGSSPPPTRLRERIVKVIEENDDYDDDRTDSEDEQRPEKGSNFITFAPDSITSAIEILKPTKAQAINYIISNMKIYHIYACRAIGVDVNASERWFTPTLGSICFFQDLRSGRIRWKHDMEYNTFSGEIRVADDSQRLSANGWCKYILFGKAGTEIMKERNKPYKDEFTFYLQPVQKMFNLNDLVRKTEKRRLKDIDRFGLDCFNDEKMKRLLTLMDGDLTGKIEFSNCCGKICGVHFISRPVNMKQHYQSLSLIDLNIILQTMQQNLNLYNSEINLSTN